MSIYVDGRYCIVNIYNFCYEIKNRLKKLYNINDDRLLDIVIEESLNEYSDYDFLYVYKKIHTKENQYVIDIYKDISPYLIDIIYFGKYSNLNDSIIYRLAINNMIYNPLIMNNILGSGNIGINVPYEIIVSNYVRNFIREWIVTEVENIIYEDRYIKVEPNAEYEVLYIRRYTCNIEIPENKFENILKLCEYNLMIQNVKNQLVSKTLGNILNSNIRSVSISGMNVSFYNTPPERLINELENEKQKFLEQISDIDDYLLPERF